MTRELGSCPACGKTIELNEAQAVKVDAAVAALQQGTHLKLGCPHCRQPIKIGPDGRQVDAAVPPASAAGGKPAAATKITPPVPPDLSWLGTEEVESSGRVDDMPLVLILVADDTLRHTVTETYAELGFHPVCVDSSEQAIARMRFEDFKAVVYHAVFEPVPLRQASFHQHMGQMAMSKRRYMHYLVIGPECHTLYDLEALAESANLVVNDRDAGRLGLILRKSLADYEDLFGPYLAALKEFGKK